MRRAGPVLPLLVALSTVIGCDKGGSTTTPDGGGDGPDARATAPAEGQHEVLANGAGVEELHPGGTPNTDGILKSTNHHETSYDASAPATVLVATTWGHGSGVIIDPEGWVLTNYHVVESGETADFDIDVTITVPKIEKDGRATPGKKYKARAYKADPDRDLALLKIEAPEGETFPVAPLAQQGPRPGTAVAAVGNAGVGFGWAIKHCNVNAVGTMESAAQVIFAQQHDTLGDEYKDQISKAAREAAKKAGTLIQTDCTILPGDSGGPLIDESTHEVVGLNVAVKPWTEKGQQLGSVAFHIHLEELQKFMSEIPADSPSFVPDPWELGGAEGISADGDRDGEIDSLKLLGTCGAGHMCGALFVDIDQDSFNGADPGTLASIYEKRGFDAEFIVYQRGRMPRKVDTKRSPLPVTDEYFFFDGDGDGKMDGLLLSDGELGTRRGYRREGEKYVPDPALKEIDKSVFAQAEVQSRFEKYKKAYATGGRADTTGRTAALEIKTADNDGDGTVETAIVTTRTDERLLIDLDENAELDRDLQARLADHDAELDIEFLAIKSSPTKVYYDTDDDGAFDLLLEGTDTRRAVTQLAFVLREGQDPEPAPIHVGRKLFRPALAGPHAERLTVDLAKVLHAEALATDDGLGSFPTLDVVPMANVEIYDDANAYLVAVEDAGRVMVLADLDENSYGKNKKPTVADARDAVRGGSFDAEFAFVFDGTVSWAYFDTDADGDWDVINVSHGGDPLHAHYRFGHEKGAKVMTGAPVTDGHHLFHAEEFKNKRLRKRFEKVKTRVVAD